MENTFSVKVPSGMPLEFDPEVTGEGLEVLDDEAQLERLRHAIQEGIESGPPMKVDWREELRMLHEKYAPTK